MASKTIAHTRWHDVRRAKDGVHVLWLKDMQIFVCDVLFNTSIAWLELTSDMLTYFHNTNHSTWPDVYDVDGINE